MANALAYGSDNSDLEDKYDELWHKSEKLAQAHWDLETSGTFLYKAGQRAEFARKVLKDLQSEKFTSQGAALKKINEAVREKYGQGYAADNMIRQLAKRVTASGSVSAWDLRDLDWQMLSLKLKVRMKDIGVTPTSLPAMPTNGTFFKDGIKYKYREARNALQSLTSNYPELELPPVNPFMFFVAFPGGKRPEIKATRDFSVPDAEIRSVSEDSSYTSAPDQGVTGRVPDIDFELRQQGSQPSSAIPIGLSKSGLGKAGPDQEKGQKKKKTAGEVPSDQSVPSAKEETVPSEPKQAGAKGAPGTHPKANVPKVVVKPGAKSPSKSPSIPSAKPSFGGPAAPGQAGPFEGPIQGPEAVRIKPDKMVSDLEKERARLIKGGQPVLSQTDKKQPRPGLKKARRIPVQDRSQAEKGKPVLGEGVTPSGPKVTEPGEVSKETGAAGPAEATLPAGQATVLEKRKAGQAKKDQTKPHNKLYKDSGEIAQSYQDLSNPNTDLGEANQRAKDAREILGEIKSWQDIDPAAQAVIKDKIKQIVNDRYGDSLNSRQMAQGLINRVGSDGSIDDNNPEELDWQMVPSRQKAKLENLGVSPAKISVPISGGTFLEKGLKNKYEDNRQVIKSVSRGMPNLSLPPVNPIDFKGAPGAVPPATPQKAGVVSAIAGATVEVGAAKFYLKYPIDRGGLRVARRGAAGKLAGKPQRMGSGHWQPQLQYGPAPEAPLGEIGEEGALPEEGEEGMWPQETEPEEGPAPGAGLEGGRPGPLPTGAKQPAPPSQAGAPGAGQEQPQMSSYDLPPGEDVPDEDLPENLRKERQEYRDKQTAATLAMLPMMIGSGGLDDVGQLEGLKDPETGGNLDLSGSLEDVTGQRGDPDTALNASDKEIEDMKNEEAGSLARKKKKGEPEEDEGKETNKRNARKAKLAAGLRRHIKNHKNTQWGILFGISAFEDLIAVLDVFVVGILYLVLAPIIFACWIYKTLALQGKEGENDKSWKYSSWITEQIPYINYLPAALGYIFKMYLGSRNRMMKAQKQLRELEKKMSKRQAKRRVKKLQQQAEAA